MPLFYQHNINASTKLGIWQITEPESYFLDKVPLQRSITHPHKRLQHLAGRLLLRWLFPDFPYQLIQIADTRKPYLANEAYHFSISHCGDYAAAIVSTRHRVGIDIEMPTDKVMRIRHKFLNERELDGPSGNYELQPMSIRILHPVPQEAETRFLTLLWSAKEAVFKWFGNGEVDFREHIHLNDFDWQNEGHLDCQFSKMENLNLEIHYRMFDDLCLTYTVT